MSTMFGNFLEIDDSHEYLIMGFSPSNRPIQERWRNNGLSADFMADYWGTFFPTKNSDFSNKRAEIKNTIAFIANELLENTMKFSFEAPQYPITIKLSLFSDEIRFYATNSVNPETVKEFQEYLQKLLTGNLEELYMEQLEMNARDQSDTISRLGFLTMLHDYSARLAWKFTVIQDDPQIITVTTMVRFVF